MPRQNEWSAKTDLHSFMPSTETPITVCLLRALSDIDISVFRELVDGEGQIGSDDRSAWIGDALRLGLVEARQI